MNKIKIAYAYKGLTYLPLFLANSEKRFNSRFYIDYTNGDEEAIQKLKENKCDIAICDPFAVSDLLHDEKGNKIDSLKLIGCLIEKSPIWIYREDTNIISRNISSTDELKGNDHVKVIKGYAHPNTGWIFCKELFKKLDTPEKNIPIQTVHFDPDIEDKVSDGEILLTSNILKIAIADHLKGNSFSSAIYNYGCSNDPNEELKDLFFTGIIAKNEKYIEQELEYLLFFDELKKAIKLIYDGNEAEIINRKFGFFKDHIKKYPAQMGLSIEAKKEIFKNILRKIRQEQLYPRDLKSNYEKFDRMMRKRKEYNSKLKSIDYYDFVDNHIFYSSVPRARGWGERLLFFFERLNSLFIKPFLRSKLGSPLFYVFIASQVIPALATIAVSLYLSNFRVEIMGFAGASIGLILTVICSKFNSINNEEEQKISASKRKMYDALSAFNIGLQYAILFLVISEIIKQ